MLTPVCFMDTPLLDCSVTAIPAADAGTLEVVSSAPGVIHAVEFLDGIGRFIGVYRGAVGQEKLAAIIGGGGKNVVTTLIRKGERISLRSFENTPINQGGLAIQFLSTSG